MLQRRTRQNPAIVKRQYGEGKVVFLAFDLIMSSANFLGFPAHLKNILDAVHTPATAPYRPGRPVPVEISVKSLGATFDLRITETWPAGIELYDPETGGRVEEHPWVKDQRLEANDEKKILFYALMPEQAGIYTTRSEVGYLENGSYAFYQEFKLDLEVGGE